MDKIDRTPLEPSVSLLAVDPGINGTGWALWDRTDHAAPTRVGILRKKHDHYHDAAYWIAVQLRLVIAHREVGNSIVVTCEMPEYQTGAARSMGWMRGDLQKLTFLVGAIGYMAREEVCKFEPVPVSQWKGQLPKDVVTDRIIRIVGAKKCEALGIKTHAWDATGIGLWRLGLMT